MTAPVAVTERHEPARTCVACRTERRKGSLLRVVRGPDGSVSVDPAGRLPGRGAYLCRDAACWSRALRRGALQRALGAPLPASIELELEQGPGPDQADPAAAGREAPVGAAAAAQGGAHGA
jgi:predicted RNA-binding protein YlxR (DUF448 family)